MQAEDAWQTLAACFELVAALDSPDPAKYVSHLPVQQDGTCNGLQHYAALGGDRAGAAQVNLEPSDRPSDVYTAVAEAVKAEVEKDAQDGDPIAQQLRGHITRKCVKQPVMTNVYGVTFHGARRQVQKQLEVIFPGLKDKDSLLLAQMANYVARKIFKCLGQMFTGAQKIQKWLGQCADRVATCLSTEQLKELKDEKIKMNKKGTEQEEGEDAAETMEFNSVKKTHGAAKAKGPSLFKALFKSTVVWTTPLRLPVVQPYRSSKSKIVSTSMQDLSIQDPQVSDPVSRRKQLQAFPPNFIHSLDASHMLLSALKCTEDGMTFASIHDSFWTHACDVNRMSEVLRDTFVAMHSEDIIGRLREEFEARYKGHMYMATVPGNSAVAKRIRKLRQDIRRQAKKAKVEWIPSELALELDRMRLMQSEDAVERGRGEAMVTPASIVESESDTAAFAPSTELAGTTLGEMPVNAARVEDERVVDCEEEDEEEEEEDPCTGDYEANVSADEAAFWKARAELRAKTSTSAPSVMKQKKRREPPRKLYVWLPLTFPEVPEKGDFDVRRLRESRYFFH
jgi:DNA-directed RNA polymerase